MSSNRYFKYISKKDIDHENEQKDLDLSSAELNLVKSNSFYIDNKEYGYRVKDLGSGAYGDVTLFGSKGRFEVVIKKIDITSKNEDEQKQKIENAAREAELNKIVYGIGEWTIGNDKKFIYIKMKKLPPNIHSIYFEKLPFRLTSLSEFIKLFISILKAVDELHEKCGIIHLDLNFSNICMDDQKKIYFCDFGAARQVGELTAGMEYKNFYSPAEIINKIEANPNQDVYILGKMFQNYSYEMKTYKDFPQYSKLINEISCMTDAEPLKRPTLKQIIEQCSTTLREVEFIHLDNKPSQSQIKHELPRCSIM